MKKIVVLLVLLLAFNTLVLNSQQDTDKYSAVNLMIYKVYFTNMGMIIDYILVNEIKTLYLPNKFFTDGIAVKIIENDSRATPQMNVIYKNKEPFKVKIYIPSDPGGETYKLLDYLTPDIIEKFKATDKLNIEAYQAAPTQPK